jgi:hypothetical protein
MEKFIEFIREAQESVFCLIYASADDGLALACINVNTSGGEYQKLLDNGFDLHIDGNPKSMHH